MPKQTKKCSECAGCMVKFWILPDRYYYCEFCKTYYAGNDSSLELVDRELVHKLLKENNANIPDENPNTS
jgi:hypothetical protein